MTQHAATLALFLAAIGQTVCAAAQDAPPGDFGPVLPLPAVAGQSTMPTGRPAPSPAPAPTMPTAATEEQPFVTPERLQQGLTIVVVGVNGDNIMSAGLAPGLVEGGFPGAVEVVDWTTGHWPLFVYHLRAEKRHQTYARLIAQKIVAYQDQYPGRPVNVVGYSAGAVVTIESLEALPPGRQVDRAILLAGAISPLYDLRTALVRTRGGIVSYYQVQDVVALWAGTLLAGTADGTHLPSAGAVKFWTPPGFAEADKRLYRDKLVQLPYKPQMALSGNLGGHFQCVGHKFVAAWIAPQLVGSPRNAERQAAGGPAFD